MNIDLAVAQGFREVADVSVTVKARGHAIDVPPGDVKAFGLHLETYGFTGWLELAHALDASRDPLFDAFVAPDLLQVDLALQVADRDMLEGSTPPKLEVRALVTEKALEESSFTGVEGAPVLLRRYHIRFADPAAVLWTQHFPTVLQARASVADVVSRLGAVGGIDVKVDWSDLGRSEPHVCLALGEGEASFRDYVVWLAASRGGCLTHDYATRRYRLGLDKPKPPKARAVRTDLFVDVPRVRAVFPATPRHTVRIDNAHAERHGQRRVENPLSADGVVRDVVVRTGVSDELEAARERERLRLRAPGVEVLVPFRRYPDVPILPGDAVTLSGPSAPRRFTEGADHRVLALALEARALDPHPEEAPGAGTSAFEVRLLMRLERADDPVARLPPFVAPRWPVLAEAVVTVDAGEGGDRNYAIARDEATSREYTEVTVPVWGQRIGVHFQPGFFPGHLYAPPFKGQRVLVALHHDRAELVSYLDWAEGVRLPADGQGNHLLLGKSPRAQTSIRHHYVDDVPALSVSRKAERDHEVVELAEGVIVLETKEEPG